MMGCENNSDPADSLLSTEKRGRGEQKTTNNNKKPNTQTSRNNNNNNNNKQQQGRTKNFEVSNRPIAVIQSKDEGSGKTRGSATVSTAGCAFQLGRFFILLNTRNKDAVGLRGGEKKKQRVMIPVKK